MNAKDLVKENNKKRELLNEENLKDYEEMLAYIRIQNKSEQQSEEILMELLDHLLEAQEQGKNARDIFGEDLKAYCKELIHELPREKNSDKVIFLVYLGLNLLGLVGIVISIISLAGHYFFNLGSKVFNFYLGTGIVVLIIDLLLLALFIYIILKWINGSLFKKSPTRKWVEFLQLWIISMLFIGSTMLVLIFMPEFGNLVSVPFFIVLIVSFVLYLSSVIINKKLRLTK